MMLCGRAYVKSSWWCGLVHRFIEQLSTEESALELLPQQAALSLRTLHEAAVLLRSARQVRDDLVHRAVRHILVHREPRLTCSQKHKHVNTIRIKSSAPPHAALLSTHPTGSWSDRTSPAAGQSKPYSPWERDSSRSFCAEEHTLEIIDLWIILRVWTHFSSVNLTVSSLWDATMTFAILLWLISSRMYSRHLTDRSGLMKASSTTETDEQKEVILKYVLFVATSGNIPLSVRANVYCVIVTHVSNVTLMDKISSAQINRCVWSWIQYSSETRERD